MIRRAILFAFLFFFVAISSARADDPITLAQYQRLVDRATQLVQQSQGAPLDQRAGLLTQAAELLAQARQVKTEAGEIIAINNDNLIKDLNAAAQDSQHLSLTTSLPTRLRWWSYRHFRRCVLACSIDRQQTFGAVDLNAHQIVTRNHIGKSDRD